MARLLRGLLTLRAEPPAIVRQALGVAGVLVVIAVWWALTRGDIPELRPVSPVLLPSPMEVVRSVPVLFTERGLMESIFATLKRVMSGFGLAILVGVPLGILAGAYRVFDAVQARCRVFARNIPVAVLIPLTISGIASTRRETMFIFIATAPSFLRGGASGLGVHDRYVRRPRRSAHRRRRSSPNADPAGTAAHFGSLRTSSASRSATHAGRARNASTGWDSC